MATAFSLSSSVAFAGAHPQPHLPRVRTSDAYLREADGAPSVSGSSATTSVALAALAASAVVGASASWRKLGGRRAAKVGRRFFVSEKEQKAQASEAAERAAEEERDRKYQEFLSARDALNLPNAIPFLGAPAYRSFMFNVPGDAGFDPLNIVRDEGDFEYQRRAELTHCRFAMLAAVGWPLSEIYQPILAKSWGLENKLAAGGRAPSVLNGGLSLFEDSALPSSLAILLAAGFFMANAIEDRQSKKQTFDPLNLEDFSPPVIAGMLPEGRKWMAEAELKNGRMAMVAITAYVVAEFYTKVPVVKETPYLFSASS